MSLATRVTAVERCRFPLIVDSNQASTAGEQPFKVQSFGEGILSIKLLTVAEFVDIMNTILDTCMKTYGLIFFERV